MDNNPYSSPNSDVTTSDDNEFALHEPKSVPFGNGWKWIAEGFGHFSQAAGQWILICIVGFLIMMVLNFIPLVNMIAGLTASVWLGGLMLGCRAQDTGEGIQINHLFAGFGNKVGQLIAVSVIATILTLAIFGVVGGTLFIKLYTSSATGADPASLFSSAEEVKQFVLAMLIGMALIIPVMAMVWFAPALIVLNNVPLFTAFKMSFKACLINTLPMLLYGFIFMFIFILATLPLALGLLVVMPAMYGSIYRSYKDIFID